MMMSSLSRRLPRRSTVSSVILPAGNITQTARGFSSSAFTTSGSDPTAVAPSWASASRGLASASKTTQWCPAFIRRREMLPPMRPRPITPICIAFAPYDRVSWKAPARQTGRTPRAAQVGSNRLSPGEPLCAAPAPALDLRHILAILADMELVALNRAPVALGRLLHLAAEPRDAANGIERELVTVEVVQHHHVKRGGGRAFLAVAA